MVHTLASIPIVRCCCAALCAMLGMSPISAQPTFPAADLAHCAEIDTDTVRLACFDALARALDARAEPPDDAAAETDTADAAVRGVDAFGSELVRDGSIEMPDEISSRFVGEFTGWRGNTVFTLENGQVWRQAEEDRLIYRADSPIVTLRRGTFDTYRLSVEGVGGSVRVLRVR